MRTNAGQVIEANENECRIRAKNSPDRYVLLKFLFSDVISIECCDIRLRLEMHKSSHDFIQEKAKGIFIIQSCAKDHVYELDLRDAVYNVEAPWGRAGNEYIRIDIIKGVGSIREYALVPCESDTKNTQFIDFTQWNQNYTYTGLESRYCKARDLASYILWSAFVRPEGKLTRNSVYSSKNWMTNIWSWDNCFCALAMVESMPDLALDQLLVFADNQHKAGAYPDCINDRFSLFSFCKPPIHGWTLLEMIKRPISGSDFADCLLEPLSIDMAMILAGTMQRCLCMEDLSNLLIYTHISHDSVILLPRYRVFWSMVSKKRRTGHF